MKITLDASAAINIALGKSGDAGLRVLEQAELVVAPELFLTEVANAFWKYHQFENLPLEECLKFKQRCLSMLDRTISGAEIMDEAFLLSCQFKRPVYDACYLVCSKRMDTSIVTSDQKLAKIALQLYIPCILLPPH